MERPQPPAEARERASNAEEGGGYLVTNQQVRLEK
jgi:hypothetical protein